MVAHNVQTVGQSLLLECIVTTVRGITSTIDIAWSSLNVVFNTERNVSINLTTSYSASYTNTYIIPQLSTLDDGRVYNCEVVMNSNPPVSDIGRIELDIIGKLCTWCAVAMQLPYHTKFRQVKTLRLLSNIFTDYYQYK